MGRYYFQIIDGEVREVDEEGVELPTIDAVREEAFMAARGLMTDAILEGADPGTHRYFAITDKAGNTIGIVPFAEAMRSVK